jgi:hypothetical protein
MVRASFASFVTSMLVLVAACHSEEIAATDTDFSYATANRACAPTDGPAVAITLMPNEVGSAPPPVTISVRIMRSVADIAGHSWAVADGGEPAVAWATVGASSMAAAGTGRIDIVRADTTATIDGTIDIAFSNAGRIRGAFRATWVQVKTSTSFCG